jgi:hypothetical protein
MRNEAHLVRLMSNDTSVDGVGMTAKTSDDGARPLADPAGDPEQDKARQAAADFLEQATRASDPAVRAGLLAHAQKWLEIAGRASWMRRFGKLVAEFNEHQMRKG